MDCTIENSTLSQLYTTKPKRGIVNFFLMIKWFCSLFLNHSLHFSTGFKQFIIPKIKLKNKWIYTVFLSQEKSLFTGDA